MKTLSDDQPEDHAVTAAALRAGVVKVSTTIRDTVTIRAIQAGAIFGKRSK